MMMKLTDNELDMLKKYEDRMRTAVYSDYCRNIMSFDLEALRNIYNKIHNTDYRLNKTCSTCQLNFMKLLGRWWFDNKEKLIRVVEEPEPILEINELDQEVTNKELNTKKCPTRTTKKTTIRQQQKR